MKITKSSGELEEFSAVKLVESISLAAKTVGAQDSEEGVENFLVAIKVVEGVQELVEEGKIKSTKEIKNEVIRSLAVHSKPDIARAYMMFEPEEPISTIEEGLSNPQSCDT